MKFCKRVSKFKMADSKGPPGACQNPTKILSGRVSESTGRTVLKFGDMIGMKFC